MHEWKTGPALNGTRMILMRLGFLKIDVLALGMLTCIRKAFDLAKEHYGLDLTLANIPQDDPAVYEMICHADTIGVFPD